MARTDVTPEALFAEHFFPLYPPEQRADLRELVGARYTDAVPAPGADLVRELEGIAAAFAELAPRALGKDDLVLDFTDASIHRLGAALTRKVRDAVLARGDLAQLVVHGAVYVAATAVRAHGGVYRPRRPLWETVVTVESRAGRGDLAPFHWWLKALSDAEIDKGGLTSRWVQHVERARLDPATLPVLVDRPRTIPALPVVRWDNLNKHLRAHVPELRDLGPDFPSAEQLDEIGFLSLEFLLVADGRYLVVHGRGRAGLHLFWLDRSGFSHARFFPADPPAPHTLVVEGDTLIVRFALADRPVEEQILCTG